MSASVSTVFVFDWDGTLLDVTEAITQSIVSALNGCITDPTLRSRHPLLQKFEVIDISTVQPFIGQRFKEQILPAIFPLIVEDPKLPEVFFQAFVDDYGDKDKNLFPGVRLLLEKIQSIPRCALALASNKSRFLLEPELEQQKLAHLFDHIACGDDPILDGQVKPHPYMLESLQPLWPQAETWYMVGDTPADMLASRRAHQHFTSVGVHNNQSIHCRDQLIALKPHVLLEHIGDFSIPWHLDSI